jgi:hypothetical protein
MNNLDKKIDNFLNKDQNVGQEICDTQTGICYIKTSDGLIERKIIERKLVLEDGRELLREEIPISNSNKKFLI